MDIIVDMLSVFIDGLTPCVDVTIVLVWRVDHTKRML